MTNLLTLKQAFTPGRPPVLLLAGPVLVRTLGLAGIPLIVASSDAADPAFASRYCGGRCVLPPKEEPEAMMDSLIEAGDRLFAQFGRRVPLMYGNDFYLELIYTLRKQLEERFLLLLTDPEPAYALLTKDRFETLARERNLPVPRSLTWEELPAIEGAVLAKPSSKFVWSDTPLQTSLFAGDSKALIFGSGREAAAQPLVERFRNQLTFQEYIRGDDRQLWSYHGFSDEHGKVLASFVGRKLRTSPPLTGESAFIELIHDEALAIFGRELAERVHLKGAFKLDFKTDAPMGRHYLLEINARFNLWHYLGAVNGINLMQIAYDYMVDGKRPGPQTYVTSWRWLFLPYDFRAYRCMAARGELSFAGWIVSILSARTVYNIFAWNDPAPFLMTWVNRFVRKGRKTLVRVKMRLREWLSTAY